jgi:hypothetical protein
VTLDRRGDLPRRTSEGPRQHEGDVRRVIAVPWISGRFDIKGRQRIRRRGNLAGGRRARERIGDKTPQFLSDHLR